MDVQGEGNGFEFLAFWGVGCIQDVGHIPNPGVAVRGVACVNVKGVGGVDAAGGVGVGDGGAGGGGGAGGDAGLGPRKLAAFVEEVFPSFYGNTTGTSELYDSEFR